MTKEKKRQARLMIAGTNSGCGKTSVTAAVMMALKAKNRHIAPYKCGPDYIDPMFHRHICGVPSINLDGVFSDNEALKELFSCHMEGKDIAILEGVMGYYDGQGATDRASSYHLASALSIPTVLVVRPKGQALSTAALICGYRDFRKPSMISGIILNGIREGMYDFYKKMIEAETGLTVYGFLPDMPENRLESRHLGLITDEEQKDLDAKLVRMGELAEKYNDLEGLSKLAESAEDLEAASAFQSFSGQAGVRLAVARDRAFCFYYEDNLECLRRMGVTLVPFSPISDRHLPEDIHGIYLGGGYPELFGRKLSENKTMLEDMAGCFGRIPIIAECGGYMYLTENLTDLDGQCWQMAGVIRGQCRMERKLGPFGYVELSTETDSLLGKSGCRVPAHEFHYSSISGACEDLTISKKGRRIRHGGQISEMFYGAYPHLYFYSCPELVKNFVRKMEWVKNDH